MKAARTLLVEMMADLDEEVAELFLMEEEVRRAKSKSCRRSRCIAQEFRMNPEASRSNYMCNASAYGRKHADFSG